MAAARAAATSTLHATLPHPCRLEEAPVSTTKISTPVPGYSGVGPGGIVFTDGVASTDDEAIIAYCTAAGYGIEGKHEAGDHPLDESEKAAAKSRGIKGRDPAKVRAALAEPIDPRDIEDTVVGTRLRDAAVDPQPGDFLPPTNAGEANPHGPLVVAPGIHAVESQIVRPGQVFVDDLAAQQAAETELATKLLVERQDAGDAVPTFDRADEDGNGGSDTGPLGLSDPGSVGATDTGNAADGESATEPDGSASDSPKPRAPRRRS